MPVTNSKIKQLLAMHTNRTNRGSLSPRTAQGKNEGTQDCTSKNTVLIRNPETGSLEWVNTSDPQASSLNKGGFTGKVGSVRRSSKGGTRRMPNGSRKYLTSWDSKVIAYKLKPL